jgi:hypothetical protein
LRAKVDQSAANIAIDPAGIYVKAKNSNGAVLVLASSKIQEVK